VVRCERGCLVKGLLRVGFGEIRGKSEVGSPDGLELFPRIRERSLRRV
jgi:hypothetical protein